MIKLIDLLKTYGKDEEKVEALKSVNIDFYEGKFNCIVGKSGSGKSTLLNLIGALDNPTSGKIIIDDVDISNFNENEKADFRNKKIGYIFQSFYLEPTLSVIDNITIPLLICGIDKKTRDQKGIELLKKFNLLSKKDKLISQLSGGEKQRVCIIRALINNPKIILADEPTGSLDTENGRIVLETIKAIADEGKTVIMITHNVEDAKKYSDVIIQLSDGEVKDIYENK